MSSAEAVVEPVEVSKGEQTPEYLPQEPDVFMFGSDVLNVCFQPKTNREGIVFGYEALTRRFGSQSAPVELLEKAEKSGSLHTLTLEVLRVTCERVASLSALNKDIRVSVNVSPTELKPEAVKDFAAILEETGVDTALIELEITEGYPIEEHHFKILESLHGLGVHIAIDDYGTGHATSESLARIRKHGSYIDTVKVDKGLLESGEAVSVAQQLIDDGYEVVVEGIERKEQANGLPDSCLLQGHAYGDTVSASILTQLLMK